MYVNIILKIDFRLRVIKKAAKVEQLSRNQIIKLIKKWQEKLNICIEIEK